MVRFGEAEAADQLAARERGQISAFCASLPKALIGTMTSEDCTLIMDR